MKIKIFATGGTFEKEYNEITQKLDFTDTHLPQILKHSRTTLDINVEKLMLIDSLEMTDDHRKGIAQKCTEAHEEGIIITHGTDTMVETAKFLAERVRGKTIILTGAMHPYKFGSSDAAFNLGTALAFVQTLPQNVYIVMNGRYYAWDNCRKNLETGRFEEIK